VTSQRPYPTCCAPLTWPDRVARQCGSQPTLLPERARWRRRTAVVSKVSLHVKQAANEPSTGLFYVQEHVKKSAHQLLANQVRPPGHLSLAPVTSNNAARGAVWRASAGRSCQP
jgi:hypothetical protein